MNLITRLIKWLSKDTAYKTAVHELGHCMLIKYYKGHVDHVCINATGHGGYTLFKALDNDKHQLRVLVAGYVAEELLEGREPRFPIHGGCYEGDLQLMREIVGHDYSEEIKLAMDATCKVLRRDGVMDYIKDKAHVLAELTSLQGEDINFKY